MTIKRGVSLYSYQQSQFFKELDLEGMIREVTQNLGGADGIELIDEMSLPYPDPDEEFVRRWFGWIDQYGAVPVTNDVGLDTLQFRDHVMTYDEAADRLKHDIRLAKKLGFRNVRCLSVVPLKIMEMALPLAESLDIRLGREIHQPMPLEGQQVTEIIEFARDHDTAHLGIVPDFGIFQHRPSEVLFAWYERQGSQPAAADASVRLSGLLRSGDAPFDAVDYSDRTAGNLRAGFNRFLASGEAETDLEDVFAGVKRFADEHVSDPKKLDYIVVAEAINLAQTSTDTLRELAPYVINCHGKFNNMSEDPEHPGQYRDLSVDYASIIDALTEGGYDGYIDSEYEGQRYFQDRGREDLMSEVDQVRRHQEMLKRLIGS